MTDALLILGVTTAAHVLLSIGVWRSKPAGSANRAFACLALTLGAWTLSNGLVKIYADTSSGVVWARSAFFTASLLPLWCFRFVAVFPTITPRVSSRLGWFMTACALASCAASLTPLLVRGTSSVKGALQVEYGLLYPGFGVYLIASVFGSLLLLARKVRLVRGVQRIQVQFVLLGIGIAAVGGSVTNLLVPLLFGTSQLSVYGPIFGLVMVAFIAHAIVRYRLLNIRLVVRRSVTEVGVSMIAGMVFLSLASALSWALELDLGPLPLAVTVIVAIVIAHAFRPLRSGVQAVMDAYFFRAPYDYAAALREMSRVISDIIDLKQLFDYTCSAIAHTLHAERVALYVRNAGDADYRLQSFWSEDGESALPTTIPDESPLVESLRSSSVIATAELGYDRDLGTSSSPGSTSVRALPVFVEGHAAGFYLFGPKRSGDPYFTEDIDLITAVASQVGIAIRLHVQIGLAEAEKRRAERLVSFGALARGLAHEIKNPLVAIRTFAELLPERANDEEFQNSFGKIVLQEIGRIDDLLARLRGLAAPASDPFKLVDVFALIEETIALLRAQIERAGVRVAVTRGQSTPRILGDPAQLKQLLLNVFINALEALGRDGEISVRLTYLPRRQELVLEIEDTGPGAPLEVLSKIFEPFVTTKPEGSGLGLAICRAIADAHHAVIRAENKALGAGMRVIVEFPVPARGEAADKHDTSVFADLTGTPESEGFGRSLWQEYDAERFSLDRPRR